jgi:hypothetical protein
LFAVELEYGTRKLLLLTPCIKKLLALPKNLPPARHGETGQATRRRLRSCMLAGIACAEWPRIGEAFHENSTTLPFPARRMEGI